MPIVSWTRRIAAERARLGQTSTSDNGHNGNGRLTMIEWLAILGVTISAISLSLNLYRMRAK